MTMKRTISGMIGAGSLAHNRRDFIAGNVDPDRVQFNICYQDEDLKEVYGELFDDAVGRYNVGKRKDRQIENYYEKIRRGQLQPIMDQVSAEIKKCGTIHTMLPKTSFLEGASTYREKIKPTFVTMKDNIAAMTVQIKELMNEVKEWKENYKKLKQKYNQVKSKLETMNQENKQLKEEKSLFEGISEKYHSVVRVLGMDVVESAVQKDVRDQRIMKEKRYMEHMPQGSIQERLRWGGKKTEMGNKKVKSNRQKNREIGG